MIRFFWPWLAILLLALFFGGSRERGVMPPAKPENGLIEHVRIESEQTQVGQTQRLFVRLQPDLLSQSPPSPTTLQLEITYANGTTQNVFATSREEGTILSWEIPIDAGTGETIFRLIASNCGCGDQARPVNPIRVEDKSEGRFWVQ